MKIPYVTCDVFTDRRFGGNQLAVFPDARDVPASLMHDIAREFNFSETTFVLPPDDARHTRRVRIFTPGGELQFAGHPTVGTAHVLAASGAIPLTGNETRIVLEEGVGPVPVTIRTTRGVPTFAELSVAQLPEVGPPPPSRQALAGMLSLGIDDLDPELEAESVSCGTPFLFIPLRSLDAVARAKSRGDAIADTLGDYHTEKVMVFTRAAEREGSHLRARMFAPSIGVPEDPATGSAAVGLGGYLAARDPMRDGTIHWRLEQGFEMGRPSILDISVDKASGAITGVRVGGSTVMVCEGVIEL